MLPEQLSNGLCSLNPEVDRLVLVCDMVISANGQVQGYQFYEAVMHSAARLTYDEVWGVLSGRDAQAIRKRAALVPRLQDLYDLYRVLAKARESRGAMEFDTIETRIVCDPAGRIERIEPRTRNDAHRLIEECMLAANVCAADFMKRSRHPGLYRVHEGPDARAPDAAARVPALGQPLARRRRRPLAARLRGSWRHRCASGPTRCCCRR